MKKTNNMEHFEKQLKKGQRVHMSPDEKSVIRYSLSKFMDSHPLPGFVRENPIHEPKILRVSPFMYKSPFTYMRLLKGVTIVLIALLVGGSTLTYASEKALPGDALYSIKVNVKEAIEEKLAVTTEAKAQYQVKRIQKRFAEIKTLENKGELTPEKEAIVEKVFDSHTEALNQTLTTLEIEGNQNAILETTTQLLPVLNDYSTATTESTASTNLQIENSTNNKDEINSTEEGPDSMAMKSNETDSTAVDDEGEISGDDTSTNTDSADEQKPDENQNHKLAVTFIQKIKKEKAHLEERAVKSAKDDNQSIDDTIKSIDTLINSINVDLDADTSTDTSLNNDGTELNLESDNQSSVDESENIDSSDSLNIQINSSNKGSLIIPTL